MASARELRLRQEEEILEARARCTAKSVGRRLATSSGERRRALSGAGAILRRERLRLHLQRRVGSIVATSLSSAKKGFDAQDLGQGRSNGGGLLHRRNRLELMLRVAAAFPALADDAASNWLRNFRAWDAQMSRRHNAAWGHIFRDEMKALQTARSAGETRALERFCRRLAREVPATEIEA